MSTHMRQKNIKTAATELEYKGFKFFIMQQPSEQTIYTYIQDLKKHGVTALVRVCES